MFLLICSQNPRLPVKGVEDKAAIIQQLSQTLPKVSLEGRETANSGAEGQESAYLWTHPDTTRKCNGPREGQDWDPSPTSTRLQQLYFSKDPEHGREDSWHLLTARDVSAISPRQASYKPTDGQQQESKPGAPIPKPWLLSLLCPSSQLSRKLQTWFCVMVDHRHRQCAGSVFKAAVPWVVTPHHLKLGERAEWLFSSGTASSPRSCPLPPQSHRSNK